MNIIFGGLLKQCCWRDFILADFSTVWRETHACSINGSIMAQVNSAILMRSPNHCQYFCLYGIHIKHAYTSNTYTHASTQPLTCTYTHTQTCMQMHTHTHACTHTYAHTNTHKCTVFYWLIVAPQKVAALIVVT